MPLIHWLIRVKWILPTITKWVNLNQRLCWTSDYLTFFPFCEATDSPVSDFWWRLLGVSKPEWVALFALDGGVCVTRSLSYAGWAFWLICKCIAKHFVKIWYTHKHRAIKLPLNRTYELCSLQWQPKRPQCKEPKSASFFSRQSAVWLRQRWIDVFNLMCSRYQDAMSSVLCAARFIAFTAYNLLSIVQWTIPLRAALSWAVYWCV